MLGTGRGVQRSTGIRGVTEAPAKQASQVDGSRSHRIYCAVETEATSAHRTATYTTARTPPPHASEGNLNSAAIVQLRSRDIQTRSKCCRKTTYAMSDRGLSGSRKKSAMAEAAVEVIGKLTNQDIDQYCKWLDPDAFEEMSGTFLLEKRTRLKTLRLPQRRAPRAVPLSGVDRGRHRWRGSRH